MTATFFCATCGKEHPGLPTDYAFGLPDEVFALSFLDRYLRVRSNSDLCTLDDSRFFVRGVIPIPFLGSEDEFCWGVWVELARDDHDKYVRGYDDDLSAEPSFAATLANQIPGCGSTFGLAVTAEFGGSGKRPNFFLDSAVATQLAYDQRHGITAERHHAMLEACGHFKRKPAGGATIPSIQ